MLSLTRLSECLPISRVIMPSSLCADGGLALFVDAHPGKSIFGAVM